MTDPTEHPHVTLARKLTSLLEAGDVEGIEQVYADDIVVFRNLDGRELVRKQVLKVVRFLTTAISGLHYENVRIAPTPDGFVQQHVFRGTVASSGEEVTAYACLVARVTDGRIARIDEYLDSAQMAPLMKG